MNRATYTERAESAIGAVLLDLDDDIAAVNRYLATERFRDVREGLTQRLEDLRDERRVIEGARESLTASQGVAR